MTARSYFFYRSKINFRTVFPSFLVSVVWHLIFVFFLFYTPSQPFRVKPRPTAININLVSLPEPVSTPDAKQEKRAMKRQTKKTPQPAKKPAQTFSKAKTEDAKPVKVTQNTKTSLKKKTFKTGAVVKSAIKEIERRVEDSRPDPIAKALERIREKVEQTKPDDVDQKGETIDSEIVARGTSAENKKRMLEQIEIYMFELEFLIRKNWALSEQLAGNKENLLSSIMVEIKPSGEIKDIWFEKKSGNSYFDESVRKAILKSDPLPPLPDGYDKPYTLGMTFTPEGLQ